MHHLQEEFYRYIIEDGEDFIDFLGKIEVIINRLRGLGNYSFDESVVMAKVLCNLPDRLSHFRSA